MKKLIWVLFNLLFLTKICGQNEKPISIPSYCLSSEKFSAVYKAYLKQISFKIRQAVDSGQLPAYELDSFKKQLTPAEIKDKNYFNSIEHKKRADPLDHRDSLQFAFIPIPQKNYAADFAFLCRAIYTNRSMELSEEYIAPVITDNKILFINKPLYWVSFSKLNTLHILTEDELLFLVQLKYLKFINGSKTESWNDDNLEYWLNSQYMILGNENIESLDIGQSLEKALTKLLLKSIKNNKIQLTDSLYHVVKNKTFMEKHKQLLQIPIQPDESTPEATEDTIIYKDPESFYKLELYKVSNAVKFIKIKMIATSLKSEKRDFTYYINFLQLKQIFPPQTYDMLEFLFNKEIKVE